VKITPPKRTGDRPIALHFPGHSTLTVYCDDGTYQARSRSACRDLLERFDGHTNYTPGQLTAFRHTTGAEQWTAKTWRGRATSMALDGSKFTATSLRGSLEGSTDPYTDLVRAIDWLRDQGVRPASISSMAWALWRTTLTAPLVIAAAPALGRSALYGGRQEVRHPREYQHMQSADIVAAYPTSMAARPFATRLRRVDPTTRLDPDMAGVAEATVWVPHDAAYPPLPVRLAPDVIQWQRGIVWGRWAWCELAAAQALGFTVRIEESWAPAETRDLFGAWWVLIAKGRDIGGNSARLVKMVANSLWGLFGMRGDDRGLVRWTDSETSHTVEDAVRKLPHSGTAHVAAEVSARVRARMLSEGLYGGRFHPVHVDTDGIIIRRSAEIPTPTGDGPGQWRRKATMRVVDIRAPQVYRYQCGLGCGVRHAPWHYVCSGVPPSAAQGVFDRMGHGVPVGWRERDVVAAPGWASSPARTIALAAAIRAEVYGPELGTGEAP
jgi:DNA polymerase type B, organellar and viral